MISSCPPYYSSALSCLLRSHHVLLFRLVAYHCLLVRPRLVALSSLLLSLSLSPCRSHPVFIFCCLAILLAFCLLFSATRQLLSDIEKLGCGCHPRAPKPISVSCVCRGAEARKPHDTGFWRSVILPCGNAKTSFVVLSPALKVLRFASANFLYPDMVMISLYLLTILNSSSFSRTSIRSRQPAATSVSGSWAGSNEFLSSKGAHGPCSNDGDTLDQSAGDQL